MPCCACERSDFERSEFIDSTLNGAAGLALGSAKGFAGALRAGGALGASETGAMGAAVLTGPGRSWSRGGPQLLEGLWGDLAMALGGSPGPGPAAGLLSASRLPTDTGLVMSISDEVLLSLSSLRDCQLLLSSPAAASTTRLETLLWPPRQPLPRLSGEGSLGENKRSVKLLLAGLAALGCTYFCCAGAGCIGGAVPWPALILMPAHPQHGWSTAYRVKHQ